MTAEELSERFDLSISAARIRLQELERMERSKTGRKRPLPESVLEFLREAEKKGFALQALHNKF